MRWRWRVPSSAWRIAAWAAAAVVTLVLLLSLAVIVAGNTAGGRQFLTNLTARLTDGQVQITGLSGRFPQDLEAAQLSLHDAKGVWLTAEQIKLHWSPLALLRRRILVDRVHIARLDMERMPAPRTERTEGGNRLPRIDVREAHVDIFELGPALAGQRTQLTVNGRARLISMEDARAYVLATRVGGQGRYEVRLNFDPHRMDAAVSFEEPPLGPLQNLARLPELGAVAVTGRLTGPRQAERLDLVVHAGQLRGEAHGTVDLTHRAANLDYNVQSGPMNPRPDLAWQRIDLTGSAHGPWAAPLASGHAHVEQLQLPGGVELRTAQGNLEGALGGLQAHVQVDGLVIPGPQPQLLAQAPAVIDAKMRLDNPRRPLELTAQHPLIALQANALTAGGNPEMKLHAKLPSLAPLAQLAGQTADGPGTIDATIERRGTDTHVTAVVDADVSGGTRPDWGQLLGKGSHLQLDALLTDRKLTLKHAQLTGGQGAAVNFSGSSTRAAGGGPLQSLEGTGQVTIPNLAAISPLLAGRLTANTKLSGPWRALRAEVQANSSLSVRGSAPSDIEARLNLRDLPAAAAGTIEAHGSFDGAPLQVNAGLDREPGGVFHITVHRTDWKSAHAQGDLRTTARLAQAHGSMDVRIDHLEDLQRLLGTPLQGRMAGQVTLMSSGAQTQAQLHVTAQDAVIAGFHGTGELNAHGSVDALPVQLSLQLPELHGAPAQLNASGQVRMRQQAVELLSAQMLYHGQQLTLASPAELRFNEGLTVSELRLNARQAHLNLGGRLTPSLDMHASLQGVDAALVNDFVPNLIAQGNANADLQLHGPLSSPQGSAHFEMSGVRLAQANARTLPPLAAHGSAELRGGGAAHLDATVSAGSAMQLALHGQMPLTALGLPAHPAPSPASSPASSYPAAVAPAPATGQGTLDLTVSGKSDLTLANTVLDAQGQHATGPLTIDAHITGTAAAPDIAGNVELNHGDFRDYTQGVHLSNIHALLTGRQGTLEIQQFTARAATGDVEISGSIGVLQPLMPLQLHLKARDAQPLATDILTAKMDADLDLKGTLRQSVTLSGTINVRRADIGIPNTLPTNVAVLDVRRPGETPPEQLRRPLAITVDVHLDAPRQVMVTGRGLDAELGGNVHILGTRQSPEVSGGFDLIRGSLSLAGMPLNFTEGRVSFAGAGLTGRLDPHLDFTAQSAVGDSTATLRITGPADAPQFQLTSSPQDLPQDEILARLLFGESVTTLSASQVVTMGTALTALTGLGSGLNPLELVQKTLGLDRLAVTSGTLGANPLEPSTGATVEAGRYVANNVFVAARQSTTGVTQLIVDVDISRGLKVRTKLGNGSSTVQGVTPENDPGSSIGVAYQFEY